jgi:hypothetical protein
MYRPEEVLRPNVTVGGKGGFCVSDTSEAADKDDLLSLNDFDVIF